MSRIHSFIEFLNEEAVKIDDQRKSAKLLIDAIEFFKEKSTSELINTAGFGDSGKSPIMPMIYCIYSKFLKDSGSTYSLPMEISPKAFWEKLPNEYKKTLNDIKSNFSLLKPGQIVIFQNSKGGSNAGIVFGTNPTNKSFYIFTNNGGTVKVTRADLKCLIRGFVDFFGFAGNSDFVNEFEKFYRDDINTAKALKNTFKMGGGTVTEDGEELKNTGSEGESGFKKDLESAADKLASSDFYDMNR